MQGHVLAHFIDEEDSKKPPFPFICLTISGGHTQIVKVEDYFKMSVLGETIDDAVGEAFDKSAKILNLPYPGGPLIDKYAKEGNPLAYKFTKPKVGPMDFSFSGLKTSVLYAVQDLEKITERVQADICASFQHAATEVLVKKISKALMDTGREGIILAGGVAANKLLRQKISTLQQSLNIKVLYPPIAHCTDNTAMIMILVLVD
jgi:N6-L-threonylcarbamoyladenine synthase